MKKTLQSFREKLHGDVHVALDNQRQDLEARVLGSVQIQQRLFQQHFRERAAAGLPLPALHEIEYRVFSQNAEDGIIAFLFAVVGTDSRLFLELGVQSGVECNSANLAKNQGWNGWLVEGDAELAARAREHYERHSCTWTRDIRVLAEFVTRENVASLLEKNGVPEDIDFLSIDIDGNDWWIWKALSRVRPRVVAVEYNASFGPELSVTIPYQADFVRSGAYHGASLRAFWKLGREKGYRLVGCDSSGLNAFFVRDDLAPGLLPALSVEQAYRSSSYRNRREPFEEQLRKLRARELLEV